MTRILLIRHGNCDPVGKMLAGRMKEIHLNEKGEIEVQDLVRNCADIKISAVYASPLERTMETAEPISAFHDCKLHQKNELLEIEFGLWTGKSFHELSADPLWTKFNTFRSGTRIPEGETILEVQTRMVAAIDEIRQNHDGQTVAVVSHGDPIKTVLVHYSGMTLDCMNRIEVSTASISALLIDDYNAHIVCMNYNGPLMDLD